MSFFVYIMASGPYGTLYTGHTDNLFNRALEHREKRRPGFTSRYNVTRLVWFDQVGDRNSAFRAERRIKEWRRKWKIELIEAMNPRWEDLYDRLDELLVFWDAEGKPASAWVPTERKSEFPQNSPLIPPRTGSGAGTQADPPRRGRR